MRITTKIPKKIKKQFNLPNSILIKQGFYSSSSLLNVGEGTGLADTFILAYAPVTIGKGCSFSFRNMIITSTHDYEDFGTVIAKPVTIGDNVWVTSNVTILPGVTIGSNTVIGAGSVVVKDIPDNCIAVENPCKPIKYKKTMNQLLHSLQTMTMMSIASERNCSYRFLMGLSSS